MEQLTCFPVVDGEFPVDPETSFWWVKEPISAPTRRAVGVLFCAQMKAGLGTTGHVGSTTAGGLELRPHFNEQVSLRRGLDVEDKGVLIHHRREELVRLKLLHVQPLAGQDPPVTPLNMLIQQP